MELTSNKTVTTIVRERRLMPRLHLLTRVDIALAGGGDLYWGSMLNLSRTGVAVVLQHQLKTSQRVTIRFHF
jgi:PilZ domain-containing protein